MIGDGDLILHDWVPTRVRIRALVDERQTRDLCDVNALMVTLPFLEAETRDTMAAMGADFWRYGVHENEGEIEALTTYAHEQGLVDRKLSAAELFAPSVFELSKV